MRGTVWLIWWQRDEPVVVDRLVPLDELAFDAIAFLALPGSTHGTSSRSRLLA